MGAPRQMSDDELATLLGYGPAQMAQWRLGSLKQVTSAELGELLGLNPVTVATWAAAGTVPGTALSSYRSTHDVEGVNAFLARAPRRNWNTEVTVAMLRSGAIVLRPVTDVATQLKVQPATVRMHLHNGTVLQGIQLHEEWRINHASVALFALLESGCLTREHVRLATGYSLTLQTTLAGQGKLQLFKRRVVLPSLLVLLGLPGVLPEGTDVAAWLARRLAEQEAPLPQGRAVTALGVFEQECARLVATNAVDWIRTPGEGRGVRTFVTASSIRAYLARNG